MNYILFIVLAIYIFTISKSYYQSQGTTGKVLVVLLFLIHFASMGLAYKTTIDFPVNDAFSFYRNALSADSWFSLFGLGSSFLSFLIYPAVQAGVNLFILFLLFATISYRTFLWYFNQMSFCDSKDMMLYGIPLTKLFFLLPSLHYWSGFLGKDVLVFFFLTYLLFEFKNKSKANISHFVVILILILLRPHIFVATFVAFFMYFLTQKNISKIIKIQLSVLLLVILSVFTPILFRFAQIANMSYSSIVEKMHEINSFAIQGGSGINLMETSYIEQIWLLLFRPLFYDAKTNYQYIISIENSFVLLLFILFSFYLYSKRKVIVVTEDVKLALYTGLCILLMIASYIYNLGLASRMRLMFMPFLFYAAHQLIYTATEKKI